MTIDFVNIERVIEDWYGQATGLKVEWEGAANTHKQRAYGVMHLNTVKPIGIDENVTTLDYDQDPGRELVRCTQGNRQFTLVLKVVSRSRRPSESALYYVEKARTSLSKPSVKADLRAVDVSIARVMDTVFDFHTYQDRDENWAVLDVIMNTVVNEIDPREQGSWIENVEYAGTLYP